MDTVDYSSLSKTVLLDLANVLKSRGLAPEETAKILLEVATEVWAETVEELMETLPEDKKPLLQTLSANKAGNSEIASKLGIDEKQIQEIEMKKFAQIVQEMVPFLNL